MPGLATGVDLSMVASVFGLDPLSHASSGRYLFHSQQDWHRYPDQSRCRHGGARRFLALLRCDRQLGHVGARHRGCGAFRNEWRSHVLRQAIQSTRPDRCGGCVAASSSHDQPRAIILPLFHAGTSGTQRREPLAALTCSNSVELWGIEPLTYSMRTSRATNCAIAPDR